MNVYKLKVLSREKLDAIRKNLRGIPPSDRILILSPKEIKSNNGLIIKQSDDAVPRRGQILQLSEVSELYDSFKDLLEVGNVVTYGMYAGKELHLPYLEIPDQDNFTISVLSLNEVLYIEKLTEDDYEN